MKKASEILIRKIKEFEGLRLRAYKCPAGVWTIGYGHTQGVKKDDRITTLQADTLLREDLKRFELGVAELRPSATQCEFDALVDFAFNLGLNNLRTSTLLRKIRNNRPEADIRREFMRWVYSKGKVLPGLVKRRQWEADRYFGKGLY